MGAAGLLAGDGALDRGLGQVQQVLQLHGFQQVGVELPAFVLGDA
jgi:hypothetical protein